MQDSDYKRTFGETSNQVFELSEIMGAVYVLGKYVHGIRDWLRTAEPRSHAL